MAVRGSKVSPESCLNEPNSFATTLSEAEHLTQMNLTLVGVQSNIIKGYILPDQPCVLNVTISVHSIATVIIL